MRKILLVLVVSLVGAALFIINPSNTKHSQVMQADKSVKAPELSVGFEDYGWQADTKCCKWLRSLNSDAVFQVSVQGEPTYRKSWLEQNIAKEGGTSFATWLKTPPQPTTPDWKDDANYAKQRIEFEISNKKYNTHHLEEGRYYGISMYIDSRSAITQKKGVVFMQADQSHDTTYAKYPAFFLRFMDNSAYKWEVNVSSDSDTDTRKSKGSPATIYTSPSSLEKDVWHDFMVYFKPSTHNKGAIAVWYKGKLVVKQSHNRNFGYVPRPKPFVINNYFWVRFGAYRRPEPDKPGDVLLLFDNATSSSAALTASMTF